ncbi:MAG: ATP cone domain-containing protein [Senegalia sp. (in: firmicutes)]|uniref:ATP cone domain-containing protein n=1 Tax=Senegalia sp. (in: firmicutes) TaxID=1924098 RepID=UPI003F99F808
MINVMKRDKSLVPFNAHKIKRAIENAMAETKKGVDQNLSKEITDKIEELIIRKDMNVFVEDIQDMVENELMDSPRKDVAKRYIIYRFEKGKSRGSKKKESRLLSDQFISEYKHRTSPMKQLGEFIYYRTYSRWIPEEGRREYWWETVRRAVEYNCSLVPTTREEAEKLYDNIYNLRQFLSGRTFWVGNTPVAKHYPMANYNCSFQVIEDFESFRDLFYLLMVGSGVGVRVLKDDVKLLPKVRSNYELINEDYTPIEKHEREDSTSIEFLHNDTAKITVGDSKEGWVQSLDYYFKLISSNEYRNITTIVVNYDNVRPQGEKLKTFGGTASGHQSLKNMFSKINKVIMKLGIIFGEKKIKLRPIDCLDVANIIGENVVVGGKLSYASN